MPLHRRFPAGGKRTARRTRPTWIGWPFPGDAELGKTPRQAAMLLRRLEDSKALLEAEEACDDPLRMIPYLLDGKAVQGQVVRLDPDHRELWTLPVGSGPPPYDNDCLRGSMPHAGRQRTLVDWLSRRPVL